MNENSNEINFLQNIISPGINIEQFGHFAEVLPAG
jgi:hypothetical protein